MLPISTLKNCGSSSIDSRRIARPTGVIARVVADLEDRSVVDVLLGVLVPTGVSVPIHRAELHHAERLAAPTDPLLNVEDRTAGRGLDQERNRQQHRRQDHDRKGAHHDVHQRA